MPNNGNRQETPCPLVHRSARSTGLFSGQFQWFGSGFWPGVRGNPIAPKTDAEPRPSALSIPLMRQVVWWPALSIAQCPSGAIYRLGMRFIRDRDAWLYGAEKPGGRWQTLNGQMEIEPASTTANGLKFPSCWDMDSSVRPDPW